MRAKSETGPARATKSRHRLYTRFAVVLTHAPEIERLATWLRLVKSPQKNYLANTNKKKPLAFIRG